MRDFLDWPGWLSLIVLACWVGVALAGSFAVRYHYVTGGAWHRTPEGRWTMYRRAMEFAILGLTLINYYVPAWPGILPVSALVMCAYAAQTYVPHCLLSRAHREHNHKRVHEGTHRR